MAKKNGSPINLVSVRVLCNEGASFLCMYTTILDLGYINFVARDTTGECAWKIISGVDATISLGGCATRRIPGVKKKHRELLAAKHHNA